MDSVRADLPVGHFLMVRRLALCQFLMVRSAAAPRVSNHEAHIVQGHQMRGGLDPSRRTARDAPQDEGPDGLLMLVIASGAKQSIEQRKEWIASSLRSSQ
jgi:hypothetical protein